MRFGLLPFSEREDSFFVDERIVRFTYKLNKAVEFHILHSFSPSTCVGDSLATEGQMLVEFYVMPARTIPWKVEGPDQRSKKKK